MSVNGILYSGLSDLRTVEALNKEWLLSLADRAAIDQHPTLIYVGDAKDSGSLAVKTSEIAWLGATQLAVVAEGAQIPNSALVDGSYVTTVARYGKAYSASDIAKMTDSLGHLDVAAFVDDAMVARAMTLTNLIAALGGGFSQSAGSTGVNMTVQNYFDARALMDVNNVQGSLLAVLHSRQFNDFIDALRAETGALQWVPATVEMIAKRGTGFRGSYLDDCDFFVSNQVPTANSGADRAGLMIGRGAVLWADGSVKPDPAVIGFDIGGGKLRVEFDRDARAGETGVVQSAHLGVREGIDLAGVGIITDA
jgi:hypothetical protein